MAPSTCCTSKYEWVTISIKTFFKIIFSCLFTLNNLLMSRSISIRDGARKLLINLVRILGPSQFSTIIRELKQTLTKGYQVAFISLNIT